MQKQTSTAREEDEEEHEYNEAPCGRSEVSDLTTMQRGTIEPRYGTSVRCQYCTSTACICHSLEAVTLCTIGNIFCSSRQRLCVCAGKEIILLSARAVALKLVYSHKSGAHVWTRTGVVYDCLVSSYVFACGYVFAAAPQHNWSWCKCRCGRCQRPPQEGQ